MTGTDNRSPDLLAPAGPRALAFAVRLAVFYGALFVVYGAQVPYLPVWLDGQGLDARQVALVTAAPFVLRLFITPGCALFADNTGRHRSVIIALAWVSLAALLTLGQSNGFAAILIVSVIFAVATASIMPLTDTIVIAGTRAHGLDYGRIRLWGSLSFIAVGFAGGAALDRYGASAALWLLIAGAAATVAAAHALPVPASSAHAGREDPPAPTASWLSPDIVRLVRNPVFLAFVAAASLAQASHAVFYTFGTLHLQKLGISGSWIGALWAISVLAEVLLFAFAREVLKRVSPVHLLLAGGLAAIVRWASMSFDPPLAALVGLQVLHAFTFGATHLGAMHFIADAVPARVSGTAQALLASFAAGVVMGCAVFASGALYETFAGGAFLAMAGMGVLSSVAALFVMRRWTGGLL